MTDQEKLMLSLIEPAVHRIRNILGASYNVKEGNEHEFFTGLCDVSIDMLEKEIKHYTDLYSLNGVKFTRIHGELRHSPLCPSSHWVAQHTWAKLEWEGCTMYVDPTASQFANIFDDIPDYYISNKPPKWYYDDRKNPSWNGFTRRLNETIKIPHMIKGRRVTDGVIEFFQYEIWGRISDIIRKLVY